MISGDTQYFIKLSLSKIRVLRFSVGFIYLLLAYFNYRTNRLYSFVYFLGRYEKLYDDFILSNKSFGIYEALRVNRKDVLQRSKLSNYSEILESFRRTKEAGDIRRMYSHYGVQNAVRLRYRNEDSMSREGNLLVFSAPIVRENVVSKKGVLYLQYNNSIKEFAAIFDVRSIFKYFTLVVEPSSWGYRDLALELLMCGSNNIYVMAQDEVDFELAGSLDQRIVPIRAGAGDWIDLEFLENNFINQEKVFDVCMVASWRKLKNHKLMFKELSKLGDGLRIALVGYCWGNRTAASVRDEQLRFYPNSIVSIFEGVPHEYVFKVLSQSKVALMLSHREGANRGIYEALGSNIPVVILSDNRGVNKSLVKLGCLFPTDPDRLSHTVSGLLNKPVGFSVKEKLFAVSGTKNTWVKLGSIISAEDNVNWPSETIVVSKPNLKYRNLGIKESMDYVYRDMERFLTLEDHTAEAASGKRR